MRVAWRRPILLVVGVLAATAGLTGPAAARSVSDPDIGWPPALRRELRLPAIDARPCRRRTTRAMVRLQDRVSDANLDTALRRILRHAPGANLWGNAWYTSCHGGRLQVGVASGADRRTTRRAVRATRRLLRGRGVADDVRLVAVRSTSRQLSQAQAELGRLFRFEGEEGGPAGLLVETSLDTRRNAVKAVVSSRATKEDGDRLRAWAAASPVNVVLRFTPPRDPNAPIPTYAASTTLDRSTVDRAASTVTVTVDDPDCAADETFDTAARFAGVQVTRRPHAYVLTVRLRVNPDWSYATCEGTVDPRLQVRVPVVLPGVLGRRGLVDGARDVGPAPIVLLPPVGARAIRSLVPRWSYTGDDCDAPAVRRAFRGRPTSSWCVF
ncbi:hypothetical protein [Patulibacter sp. SYSU D01012]|uniref:hypothetical protein n=1 Tax=Patulibacter sp. SYSU D01012 TaxID=2817381 RepID=UPI001B31866C|nr:hypothetical protein [Patulibacter sp. SYSU D01012]